MRLPPALPILAFALLAAPSAAAQNVRILIASSAALSVNTAPSTALSTSTTRWNIGVRGGKLTLGGQDTGSEVLSLPPNAGGTLEVAGHRYRGGLTVRAVGSGVQAINVVDIEEYLRGVVPAEMPPLWPQAAVRAQAIIARTYAAARINPAAPYDLCSTTQCQVYGGVAKEHPLSDAAVLSTRAEVVSSGGKLADTYFSADSGGYTASSLEAWGRDISYLRAQPDPASPSAQKPWVIVSALGTVQEVAARYGVRLGKLSALSVSKASTSGRVMELNLVGELGSKTLAGANAGGFLRSLGAKSSKVRLSLDSAALTLTGSGSGHGVGLSQWGARGMAQSGKSDLALLDFYYPGASVSVLTESQADAPGPQLGPTLPLSAAARRGFGPALTASAAEQSNPDPLRAPAFSPFELANLSSPPLFPMSLPADL
ncbi:SpoIID/LytB domain-containing protein [Deinococcus detaillensis]|uniref:SpoIID/LytB domain-containing protein n=1 Tax=Deinococcus detaillensis TaxID=2592048 RepID=A0A553UUK2_9DEIO|nr:SpoIID/LytB domain-containing protein [Deinococcus detaillensis]TSA83890.1 SpoIID/LytB domain-containing protein [Deinococcus detaillensis]